MRAAVSLLLLFTSGCSFLATSSPGPSEVSGIKKPECETDTAPAVVDTVLAGANGVAMIASLVAMQQDKAGHDEDHSTLAQWAPALLPATAGGVVLFSGSAYYGFGADSKCRTAHRRWRSRP